MEASNKAERRRKNHAWTPLLTMDDGYEEISMGEEVFRQYRKLKTFKELEPCHNSSGRV